MRRLLVALLVLASFCAVLAAWRESAHAGAGSPAPGTIEAIAGGGTQTGDGIPATDASIDAPIGIAVNAAGEVFFSDLTICSVRKVSTGLMTTYAGTGSCPSGQVTDIGDGGPATSAILQRPFGLALDRDGNLYIADSFDCAIRKVDALTGIISTVAGTGRCADSTAHDGDPATEAPLFIPEAVAVDDLGNLYIAEGQACRVRKVMGGTISTLAGGIPIGGICNVSGDGGYATDAGLGYPQSVAVDADRNVYVSDSCRIREISNGIINTVAGRDTSGCYYTFSDDGPALSTDIIPFLLATDPVGNVYFADGVHCRVRRLKDGAVTTLAGRTYPSIAEPFPDCGYSGDGGPALDAQLEETVGVAVDNDSNVYFTELDENNAGFGHVRVVYDPLDAPATPTFTSTPTASDTPTPTSTPTATPTRVPSCADFDRSGTVGIGDVMLVIRHFGASDSSADLTGDGKVTVADILAAIHQYGRRC